MDTAPTNKSPASSQQNESGKIRWNSDIFNIQTIEECEAKFEEYCERRIRQLSEAANSDISLKLSILRSCIELLDRLEGKRYAHFAGRVSIFLARVLPFFDQSGLNQKGEFSSYKLPESVQTNLDKISEKHSHKLNSLSQLTDHDMEEGETVSDDDEQPENILSASQQLDPEKLYERFWKVQSFLNQPNLLYDKNNWLTFRTMVDALIHHFENVPPTCKVWKLSKSFMTEIKSFTLQLNDINMRRCFLLQIMITLHYFDSPVDTRPDNLMLDRLQLLWIEGVLARIVTILQDMPTRKEGYQFLGLATQILKSEDLWSQWKNERCQDPKKLVVEDDDIINMGGTYHKRRKLSEELKSAKLNDVELIGSQDMTRLWRRKEQRLMNAPDVAKYFNLPPEKQMEIFKDPNISFRILRLLRKSPHFFAPCQNIISSLDEYLKRLAEKNFNGNSSSLIEKAPQAE